jgi:hypothetical protein
MSLKQEPKQLDNYFTIDEAYICDVTVRTEHDFIKDRNNPTHDDLIKILKGHDKSLSISNKDHDEFTRLRDLLEEQGYIRTVRNCWNGDTIIKEFYLNGWRFKKNHRFPCAAALKNSITCARKFGWKSISSL